MSNFFREPLPDKYFPYNEQLPRLYDVYFEEVAEGKVIITINNHQIGNILTDNSYSNDGYRFHDVFHFSYAAVLGWSPCVRKMLKRKRKSDAKVDEVEDGARAIITEEAISLLVFNYAKNHNFFDGIENVDSQLLNSIKKLVDNFEVRKCNLLLWEKAILQGYTAFRLLVQNKTGVINVDMMNKQLSFNTK